ncbi:50S ribosomal protein L24 [Rappaport israeli]|uniref:50S ribosomal protein L24 n=1 Tax=Rappaport israeli TaxID=1839807 RepID=UPI000931995D|nr:50S ribosomal protein L24 [Rappaport israeli]
MKRIQKGDEVIVITGKAENKGQRGVVLKVLNDKVIVEGLNMVAKHVKPNPQLGVEGGIQRKEAPIHISNVMLYNAASGKGDRVGFKIEDGKRFRIFKSDGKRID